MRTLFGLLDVLSIKVNATVVGSIDSAAHASGNAFLPYFKAIVHGLVASPPQLTDTREGFQSCGITLGTTENFGDVVGSNSFLHYSMDMMTWLFAAIRSFDFRLHQEKNLLTRVARVAYIAYVVCLVF